MAKAYWDHEMERSLPVLQTLQAAGYETVFVGGCVRDAVAGRKLKDVDIATAATPDIVMSLFERTVPTGLAHGTVTVLFGGESYEVTTFRTDGEYEDHRRPSDVAFIADLEGDLQRRDFTMNAMAIRPDGTLVDLYGGLSDLRRGIVRCVGDADARFQEDALRMVRAVRFASTFGYSIALSAWRAIKRNRKLLSHVAMERISAELNKIMDSASPHRGLVWLAASGLLQHTREVLPAGFAKPYAGVVNGSVKNAVRELLPAMAALSVLQSVDDRWAAVFLALRLTPEEAEETLARLRFPVRRTAAIRAVVRVHEAVAKHAASAAAAAQPEAAAAWVSAVLSIGAEAAAAWLRIARVFADADAALGGAALSPHALGLMAERLTAMPCTTVRELAVGGADLAEQLGVKPGPRTGQLLQALLRAVASGETPNEREALLELAQSMEEERLNDGSYTS
ncbi:CCA tRNA nucleotidyltransferase [Paenibacillus xylaniclasticus]|uniref:CCA tRNA nucleotidyltransferase n=1 Tax=Paenibacillus xylaniclasticus TaxID=588083 RepID=UPI000FD85A11|nr:MULTISPECIES: CCA tRNA nucleotidyltransferase [Paenibacillus]GFN30681.1 CCA-adding enzyme [Paenibacillus curdlanolyticus]